MLSTTTQRCTVSLSTGSSSSGSVLGAGVFFPGGGGGGDGGVGNGCTEYKSLTDRWRRISTSVVQVGFLIEWSFYLQRH